MMAAAMFCSLHFARCSEKPTPEILLIGIVHQVPDSLSCNWKPAYDKILKYRPDQISVEYNAPDDTASHPHFLGDNYRTYFDSLTLAWEEKKISVKDSISKYFALTEKDSSLPLRYSLWKYYYLGLDMGNRDYQTYLIHQQIQQTAKLPDSTQPLGRIFLPIYRETLAARKNGEYFRLIFPLADALGIHYLYPTDHKATYTAQSEAWSNFYDQFNGKPEMQRVDSFWKEFVATEKKHLADCDVLAFLNLPSTVVNTDYLQTHVAEHLQNPHYAKYVEVWYKRNKIIAENIAAAVKQSGAQKMAVFYGNMHVFPVKKYLEEQGFVVKLLSDLE